MDHRSLYRLWKRLVGIHYGLFLAACLVCGVVSVFAMRANNLKMIELREQVFQADKEDGDVESALRELRSFVYGHMHTELSSGNNPVKPPIVSTAPSTPTLRRTANGHCPAVSTAVRG
jgi:hypothetical protein